jgi:hypothetical protein
MYCPAQASASTKATEHALERHNLLCLRQDYSRSNASETITLVELPRLAGQTAATSRGHFARAPGILLFGTSAICGLRKQRDACARRTGLTYLDVPLVASCERRVRGRSHNARKRAMGRGWHRWTCPGEVRVVSVSHHEGRISHSFIRNALLSREARHAHSSLWPSSACSVAPVEARARTPQYV